MVTEPIDTPPTTPDDDEQSADWHPIDTGALSERRPRDSRSMAEIVASGLRNAIAHGELAAGGRIKQDDVAARFDVSRSPVREAFRELASEGFIELQRDVGARVREYDPRELNELYLAREAIEPLMIAETCRNISADCLAEASALNAEGEDCAAAGQIDRYLEVDRQMHDLLLHASGLNILYEIVQGLWRRTQRYRFGYVTQDRIALSVVEHRMLLDAISQRDSDTAEDLYRIHTRRTRLTLVAEMASTQAEAEPENQAQEETAP